jgi:hypothetical protein
VGKCEEGEGVRIFFIHCRVWLGWGEIGG